MYTCSLDLITGEAIGTGGWEGADLSSTFSVEGNTINAPLLDNSSYSILKKIDKIEDGVVTTGAMAVNGQVGSTYPKVVQVAGWTIKFQ